ncbi:hypothetical protein Poly21_31950 [Allorhodopirellula heiligendammensis]|uniref:Uncharacterized protein n=1 Tax=Allorhodopirellula heiligendammensis TaxID=2714739 RepID=A0A5C6BWV3_9BACT|nr:hypothetical protein Poly21_31950 [Allorhodopirellula heiligendammensis]
MPRNAKKISPRKSSTPQPITSSLSREPRSVHDAVIEDIVGHMENDFSDVTARKYAARLKGHSWISRCGMEVVPLFTFR